MYKTGTRNCSGTRLLWKIMQKPSRHSQSTHTRFVEQFLHRSKAHDLKLKPGVSYVHADGLIHQPGRGVGVIAKAGALQHLAQEVQRVGVEALEINQVLQRQ